MSQFESPAVPNHPQEHGEEPANNPIEKHADIEVHTPEKQQQVTHAHHQEENPSHHEEPKSSSEAHQEAKVEKTHDQKGYHQTLVPVQVHEKEIQKVVENNNVQQKVDLPKVKQNQVEKSTEENKPLIKEEVKQEHHQVSKQPQIHQQFDIHANIPHQEQKVAAPVVEAHVHDHIDEAQKQKDVKQQIVQKKEKVEQHQHVQAINHQNHKEEAIIVDYKQEHTSNEPAKIAQTQKQSHDEIQHKHANQINIQKDHPQIIHQQVSHPIQPEKTHIESHQIVHQAIPTQNHHKDHNEPNEYPKIQENHHEHPIEAEAIHEHKDEEVREVKQKQEHIEVDTEIKNIKVAQKHEIIQHHREKHDELEQEKPKLIQDIEHKPQQINPVKQEQVYTKEEKPQIIDIKPIDEPLNNEKEEKTEHKQSEEKIETLKVQTEPIHIARVEEPKHQITQEPIKSNTQEHAVHDQIKESKYEIHQHHQQAVHQSKYQVKVETNEEKPTQSIHKQQVSPSKSVEQHEQHFEQQKIAPEHKANKSDLYQIHKTIQLAEEHTQKQKYRLHSENIDSIHEEKNEEKQVVLFTEFTQNDQPIHHKPELHKQEEPKIEEKHIQHSRDEPEVHSPKIAKTQVVLPPISDAKNEKDHKTIDNLKEELHQKNKFDSSPKRQSKEGIGKITKRTLHEKKVHDIIKDLHHYDQHKTMIPALQQAKKSSKKKIDLSKLDMNIGIQSNVLSVTIGQIFNKVQEQEASRLLNEIEDLRKKLGELQKRKEDREYEPYERSIQPEEPDRKEMEQYIDKREQNKEESPHDTINTIKSNKKQLTGRIYRKFQNGDSRLSEQVHGVSIDDKKSTVPIEPATISSANKLRFASTNGFNNLKSGQKQSENEFNRSAGISFRVRRANRSIQGMSEFESGQKQAGFIKNRQKMEEDKCFQARIDDRFEKLEFSEQQKLVFIERPAPRDLQFGFEFREEIEKYFIPLGDQMPKRDWSQQQLVQLAKITFKKFGVNIQSEKKATLSVKKYKNCVSFVLDSDRTILWYYQGKFYYGGWIINNVGEGEKNGWGYEWVPNKYVYSGGYKQNKRDGYGVIKFLSREKDIIYEGSWKNGFKEGQGKQIEPDDVEYVGSWLQGKKHGHGSVYISKEQNFTGYFIQGVKSGHGEEVFRNGDVYVGNYQDGKFNGKGIYTWANLSRYEGEFKDGARNGSGVWVANYLDQNSDQYQGQYKSDKKNGYGIYKWKDGTSYEGEFLNDLKHGEGLVSYGDGRTAKLQWFEGAVVPKQTSEKSGSGIKRGNSRGSSQKSENSIAKAQIKLGIEPKTKPTRISLGIEKI